MFDSRTQEQLNHLRCNDLLRQAEKHRRRRQILAANGKGQSGLHAPVMHRIGKGLSKVGDSLQERYGSPHEQPTNGRAYQPDTA